MKEILKKLNYRDYWRIAVINAEESFYEAVVWELKEVIIDREVDQRCPYEFMIFFVRNVSEVDQLSPTAFHNLTADGVLWFFYPKKTSEKYSPGLDRNHGWNSLNNAGFHGIRMVSIDNNWSGMRFRNIRFIKSKSERYPKQG
jgi:hypothetical protein